MAFVFCGILCVVTGLPVLKKFFIFLFSLLWSYLTFKNYLNDSFLLFSQIFCDDGLSNYIVVYLRLLTSAQLQRKSDFFQNFIEGERSIKEFCSQVNIIPAYYY